MKQLQLKFYTFSFCSTYNATVSTSHKLIAVEEEDLTDDENETEMESIHEYWWGEMYGRKYGCWRKFDLAGVLQGSQIKEMLKLWVKSL